ncbi:hypothetical protein HYO28_04020 [Vibrio parahaemolyticus]|nr:hypothetical protein [Vibrio parahaemolyticus]
MLHEFKFSWEKGLTSAVITALVVNYANSPTHDQIIAIGSPLATVAGILFGFVMASLTFISSNNESVLLKAMKSTNMYQPLMDGLSTTGLALISSCIFMVFSIFLPSKPVFTLNMNWDYLMLLLGFFTLIYGLFEFLSSWRKVNKVIPHL